MNVPYKIDAGLARKLTDRVKGGELLRQPNKIRPFYCCTVCRLFPGVRRIRTFSPA